MNTYQCRICIVFEHPELHEDWTATKDVTLSFVPSEGMGMRLKGVTDSLVVSDVTYCEVPLSGNSLDSPYFDVTLLADDEMSYEPGTMKAFADLKKNGFFIQPLK